MSPLSEFLQGYWQGVTEAVRLSKAQAALFGNECGRASVYLILLVAVLVAAYAAWMAGCRLAEMVKGKKA